MFVTNEVGNNNLIATVLKEENTMLTEACFLAITNKNE